MIINLNWQQFVEKYSPIKNTIIPNSPCDEHLFESIDLIKDIPVDRVWTLIHNTIEDDMYITNGVKIINSLGYLVTRNSYLDNEIIETRLEEGYEVKEYKLY